jgi:hypothetical protein
MDGKNKKPDYNLIAGSLEGLTKYLHNFTHSVQEGAAQSYTIFKYAKEALADSPYDLTRFAMPKGK